MLVHWTHFSKLHNLGQLLFWTLIIKNKFDICVNNTQDIRLDHSNALNKTRSVQIWILSILSELWSL